jgi:hypothetical protein
MVAKDLGPLTWNVGITLPNGRPTPEFQRKWETQRANNSAIGTLETGVGPPSSKPVPVDGQGYIDTSVNPAILYVGVDGVWTRVGVYEFIQLFDTPLTYTGQGGKVVRVNAGATGLEFDALSTIAGPMGPPGIDGQDGDEGPRGPPGLTGSTGAIGPVGMMGLDGQDGEDYSTVPYGLFLPITGGILQGSLYFGNPGPSLIGSSNSLYVQFGVVPAIRFTASSQTLTALGTSIQLIGQRTDTSLANNSSVFAFAAEGYNSTGATNIPWTRFTSTAVTTTTGSEVGALIFQTYHGGALTTDLTIENGNLYTGTATTANEVITSAGAIVGIQASPYTKTVPVTGFSATIGNGINFLILTPAGTLATGTVIMPASPQDGQEVAISSSQAITTLTINGNTGQTVAGAPTTFAANGFCRFKYVLATTTWYRIG